MSLWGVLTESNISRNFSGRRAGNSFGNNRYDYCSVFSSGVNSKLTFITIRIVPFCQPPVLALSSWQGSPSSHCFQWCPNRILNLFRRTSTIKVSPETIPLGFITKTSSSSGEIAITMHQINNLYYSQTSMYKHNLTHSKTINLVIYRGIASFGGYP